MDLLQSFQLTLKPNRTVWFCDNQTIIIHNDGRSSINDLKDLDVVCSGSSGIDFNRNLNICVGVGSGNRIRDLEDNIIMLP